MSGGFDVISNGRCVILFCILVLLSFPLLKSPLGFSNVEVIAIPATLPFGNDSGDLCMERKI